MKRVVPIAVTCLSLAILTPQVASAGFADGSDEVHQGNGDEGGSWHAPETIRFYVETDAIGDNRCLDTNFDWKTLNDIHWDSRVVRVCRDNGYRDSNDTFHESLSGHGYLLGAKRAAGCVFLQSSATYSPDQHPPGPVQCTKMSGATSNASDANAWGWDDVRKDKFLQLWIRFTSGETGLKQGGDPWDPNN